jgi:hypothetical protein
MGLAALSNSHFGLSDTCVLTSIVLPLGHARIPCSW